MWKTTLWTVIIALWMLASGCGASRTAAADADAVTVVEDGGGVADSMADTADLVAPVTPVYLTLVGHIEAAKSYAGCQVYTEKRTALLAFGQLVSTYGVAFNLQVSYEWLVGTRDCESDALKSSTNGLNLLDFLALAYGVEIDAHKGGGHESKDESADNYADVRYLGGQVTTAISENVGGVQWNNATQWQQLNDGWPGWITPAFVWKPEVLTLGVHTDHHNSDFDRDDLSSGIWIPSGGDSAFFTHNAAERMVYVAPGHQHSNWNNKPCKYPFENGVGYVKVLANLLQQGKLPSAKLYTASIAIPQNQMLTTANHANVSALLEQLKPLLADGRVVSKTYSAIVSLWRTQYQSEPNILRITDIDATLWDCPSWQAP